MMYTIEYSIYDIYDERITVLVIQAEEHYKDK